MLRREIQSSPLAQAGLHSQNKIALKARFMQKKSCENDFEKLWHFNLFKTELTFGARVLEKVY